MPQRDDPAIAGLNVAFALGGVADSTVLPFLPLYLFVRGYDAPLIGAVLAAAALASLGASLVWTYVADRWQRPERTVVVASLATALCALVVGIASGPIELALAVIILFVARSPLVALLDTIALQRLGGDSRNGYARIRLRMSAGWAVSVVACGALFQAAGLRLIPYVYAPAVLLFGLWVWRALRAGPPARRAQPARSRGSWRPRALPLALTGFLVSGLLLGSSFAAASNFVTLRINVLGGGALLIGAAAAFQALTEIPTMAYIHVLTKRVGHRALFVAGACIYVGVFVAWAFTSDAVVTALIKLVVGVGFAFTYVAAVVIADDLAPAGARATSQALVKASMFTLANVFGVLGGGIVYGRTGPTAMFLLAAVITGAAVVVAFIFVPSRSEALKGAPASGLNEG